jgi:hypothetical protein
MLFNCYKKDGSKVKISSTAAQLYVVVIARTKMLDFVFGKIICTRDIVINNTQLLACKKSNYCSVQLHIYEIAERRPQQHRKGNGHVNSN